MRKFVAEPWRSRLAHDDAATRELLLV